MYKLIKPYVNLQKGSRVVIGPCGTHAPAAKWIKNEQVVTLLEDAITGTWDVFDVRLEDGTEESIYGFNIKGRPGKKRAAKRAR